MLSRYNKILIGMCILLLLITVVPSSFFINIDNRADHVVEEPIIDSFTQNTGTDGTDTITTTETSGTRSQRIRGGIQREIADSKVMYAIIAPEEFKDKLIPLVNWKTYKGVPAKIYTLESIYLNYTTGRDDAANLQKFLRVLDDKSPALTWVLLAGDADVIPARKLWAGAKASQDGLDDEYVGDYYYAGLDNDWDVNNDGKYGAGTATSNPKFEGDWTPNVYLGRLPANSSSEINISVTDILRYEQDPPQGSWMKKAVFWGSLMEAPKGATYNPSSSNAYKAKELMVKPIFEEKASHMQIVTKYDLSQLPGSGYDYNFDILKRDAAIADLNAGASIINFAGQAWYDGYAIVHYDDPAGTDIYGFSDLYKGTDADAATNGFELPLFTAFSCDVGNFAKTGVFKNQTLERLLVAPNGGAIGFVGSSGTTYRGEANQVSDGNWWMDREFYEIFFNGTYQAGKTFWEMKRNYYKEFLTLVNNEKYKAMLFGYNYLGDPELNIWTDLPQTPLVNISGLWLGPHNITVTVTDGQDQPVENARVCIQNDDIYVYGTTNESGIAKIYANPIAFDNVEVVVTGHNLLTYNDTLPFEIEPGDLKITNGDIEFNISNPIINQEIQINATIRNRGQKDITSKFNVTFSLDGLVDSGGAQIGSEQSISGLAKGSAKKVSVTWTVVPGDHTIYVQIDAENKIFESYKWNNIAEKPIYVSRPELYVTSNDVVFVPDIDVYVGTKMKIKVTVHNIGDAPAHNLEIGFVDRNDIMKEVIIGQNKIITELGPAGTKTVTTTWTAVGGVHDIIVKIDPENDLPEYNETNNTAIKNITVKYPPKINPIQDILLVEDKPKININTTSLIIKIVDKDTSIFDLDISVRSSEKNCNVTINDYFGLDITLAEDWYGSSKVTVFVNEKNGKVPVNRSFNVTVKPVNDPPRFDVSNYSLSATEDLEFIYVVKAYDPESDNITFSDNTSLFNINNKTGEIRFTPTQDDANSSVIKVYITLSDGNRTSQPHMFNLTIIDVPDPPIIEPIDTQYGEVNKSFELQINATDIDSTKLDYNDDSPLFVIDIETGKISFIPNETEIGIHIIKIIVTDDTLQSSEMTFTIIINKSTEPPPVPANDTKEDKPKTDNGPGGLGYVAGVPTAYLLIVIIIIISIIILTFLLITNKRKMDSERDKFFSPEYEKEKDDDVNIDELSAKIGIGLGTGYKEYSKPTKPSKPGSGSAPKLSYDEEYEKLYSSGTAPKRTGRKAPRSRSGFGTGTSADKSKKIGFRNKDKNKHKEKGPGDKDIRAYVGKKAIKERDKTADDEVLWETDDEM